MNSLEISPTTHGSVATGCESLLPAAGGFDKASERPAKKLGRSTFIWGVLSYAVWTCVGGGGGRGRVVYPALPGGNLLPLTAYSRTRAHVRLQVGRLLPSLEYGGLI